MNTWFSVTQSPYDGGWKSLSSTWSHRNMENKENSLFQISLIVFGHVIWALIAVQCYQKPGFATALPFWNSLNLL